ncbi:hypothetical protein CTI12_AA583600 [Artemisia annua]|uniref:Transmembrane protein n=1 Tax=Artemisia annua TaxID=35608 RepID=A0A2U1KN47_ARTAN|nr:hypothetical protein CTI12_AA583600 [Artemisia annua]
MITRPTTSTTTISCLFVMVSSLYILLNDSSNDNESWWSWFLIPVLGAFVLGALLVVMARATMVTLITVFVMLACTGKRRRVLVGEGKKISSEVLEYLFKVLIKERSLVVVACATFVTSMIMVWAS